MFFKTLKMKFSTVLAPVILIIIKNVHKIEGGEFDILYTSNEGNKIVAVMTKLSHN